MRRLGFSLVELSVGLVFAGLISGFALQMNQSSGTADCYVATKTQLSSIQAAMVRFVDKNSRLPAPAQRNIGVDDKNYGREVAPANLTNPAYLTTVAATAPATGNVSYGALPFQAWACHPHTAAIAGVTSSPMPSPPN